MFEKSLARVNAEPFNLLKQMSKELDNVFDENITGAMWAPKVDVIQKDNKLITKVDLPGVKKEDVSVEVADGYLQLSGERKKETEETKDNVYRAEREYGSFCRAVPLPDGVTADKITATFNNGVLEVCVPLPKDAGKKASKIEIKEAVTA